MDAAIHYAKIVSRQYVRRRRRSRLASGVIAGIVVACVVALLAGLLCLWCCCFRGRRRKNTTYVQPAPVGGGLMGRFRRRPQTHPGMQEAGYGAPHNGGYVQPPQPTYPPNYR